MASNPDMMVKETRWQFLERMAEDSTVGDEEQAFHVGHRDGFSEAVQMIDLLTGGDGEYRCCIGPGCEDRHCPDPDAMLKRIVARLAHTPAEGLDREAVAALRRARDLAMRMTVEARIPECGHFGAIAQDLDAILSLKPPAPSDAGRDEGPCTDCGDTGWTYQTERPCACGAPRSHAFEGDEP